MSLILSLQNLLPRTNVRWRLWKQLKCTRVYQMRLIIFLVYLIKSIWLIHCFWYLIHGQCRLANFDCFQASHRCPQQSNCPFSASFSPIELTYRSVLLFKEMPKSFNSLVTKAAASSVQYSQINRVTLWIILPSDYTGF